jgi:hypothetical protein
MSSLAKRTGTGIFLAIVAVFWIASGDLVFAAGFVLVSYVLQSEYSSIINATGVAPASKMSLAVSSLCYLTAAIAPSLHELVIPMSFSLLAMNLLLTNETPTNIGEYATSVMGVMYTGYLPSFWVRLRSVNACPNCGAEIVGLSFATIALSGETQ